MYDIEEYVCDVYVFVFVGWLLICVSGVVVICIVFVIDYEVEVVCQMQICNVCCYCEGFCVVFLVMMCWFEFVKVDVNYLVNLCYNCGVCYYVC